MSLDTKSTRAMLCGLIAVIFLTAAWALGASSAFAQQTRSDNPISSVLGAVGLAPEGEAPMPNFVKRSRPPKGSLHYVSVWSQRPEPDGRVMTRAEIEAEEAQLSALRAKDERRAGHKPKNYQAKSAAGPAPRPKRANQKESCRITCTVRLTTIGHSPAMR